MAKTKETETELHIPALQQASMRLRLIGTTPLFQNRMAEKAKQHLLTGKGKKTAAEKADLKHDPVTEFRSSMERVDAGPTAIGMRVVAVKAAMCTAALETAGITKTSAQRLIFMPGEFAPLYGVPQLRSDVVRSADINRTPDIRTRAFLPKWGVEIDVRFVMPQLSPSGIATLLCNAGIVVGLGDFRQEKGKGSFGAFRVLGADEPDAEWDDLIANHARAAQMEAISNPVYANDETAELMEYFNAEASKRGAKRTMRVVQDDAVMHA